MSPYLWGVVAVFAGVMYFVVDWVPGWLSAKKNSQGRELNPRNNLSAEELGTYYLVMTTPPNQVVLGERARYHHIQAAGTSGTGKTRHAMLPWIYQDTRRGAGIINLDVKSNMDTTMLNYARAFGRGHEFLRFQVRFLAHRDRPFWSIVTAHSGAS